MDLSAVRRHLTTMLSECSPEGLPDLIGELSRAEAIASVRLHDNGPASPAPDIQPPANLIDVKAAAKLMGISKHSLYRRHPTLPFTRKLSPMTLRFDVDHLHRWLEKRR